MNWKLLYRTYIDKAWRHVLLTSNLPVIKVDVLQGLGNDTALYYAQGIKEIVHVRAGPVLHVVCVVEGV